MQLRCEGIPACTDLRYGAISSMKEGAATAACVQGLVCGQSRGSCEGLVYAGSFSILFSLQIFSTILIS